MCQNFKFTAPSSLKLNSAVVDVWAEEIDDSPDTPPSCFYLNIFLSHLTVHACIISLIYLS
jgi:hypothetical protein